MIVRFLTNSAPSTSVGLATELISQVVERVDELDSPPAPPEGFCINDYDCCFRELKLADAVDLTPLKNDKTSFLFRIALPVDTVEIKLFKENVEIATLNDNTYGSYFPSTFFPDERKIGFILDWRKVLLAFGTGCYQVKTDREIINQNSTVESHFYDLRNFNPFVADETVKIAVVSQGCIEGGINYEGFEWEQEIRLRGKFWNPQTTFETDNYQDTGRSINQIQDEITTTYDLLLEPIPVDIAKPLIYDRLLGNKIQIYDYNLFNFDRYQGIEVYPTEITESIFNNRTGNGKFKFKFTDKVQNIIKRNFT